MECKKRKHITYRTTSATKAINGQTYAKKSIISYYVMPKHIHSKQKLRHLFFRTNNICKHFSEVLITTNKTGQQRSSSANNSLKIDTAGLQRSKDKSKDTHRKKNPKTNYVKFLEFFMFKFCISLRLTPNKLFSTDDRAAAEIICCFFNQSISVGTFYSL